MNIAECKAQIKKHEGEVLQVYLYSLELKTLGVGHLLQPNDPEYGWEVGTVVSQEVVDNYFREDFDKHLLETYDIVGGLDEFEKLPEPIQHVLVNMCFNLGATRLKKFRNMLYAVHVHDWKEMANQMEDSKWFYQVGNRSKELQEMVLGV